VSLDFGELSRALPVRFQCPFCPTLGLIRGSVPSHPPELTSERAGDLFAPIELKKDPHHQQGIAFRPRRRCLHRRADWSRRVPSRRQGMRTFPRRAHHHLSAAGADPRQSRDKSPYFYSATESRFKQDQFSTGPGGRCWSPGFSRSSVLRPEIEPQVAWSAARV
jgi:hypothetical protein